VKKIVLEKGIIGICRNSLFWGIYYNMETGRAWAVEFASSSDYNVYDNPDVIAVKRGSGKHSMVGWRGWTRQDIIDSINEAVEHREQYASIG
jgi:hypothetical protein